VKKKGFAFLEIFSHGHCSEIHWLWFFVTSKATIIQLGKGDWYLHELEM